VIASRLALFVAGMNVLLAGCGDGAANAGSGRRADRDTIPTVEHGGLDTSRIWQFGGRPVLDVGGSEALVQVAGAVRLGDRLVVADAGAHQLRFYDLTGKLVRTAGREGSGPGEFRSLAWTGPLPGDSVGAWDARLRRLSVYSRDGDLGRTAAFTIRGFFPAVQGVFGDGSLLIASRVGGMGEPGGGAWRDTAVLVRMSSLGETRDTVGRFPGPEQYAAPSGERTTVRTYALPFGRETFVAVHHDRAFVGTGNGFEITAYDPRGRGLGRLRVRVEPRPVSSAEIRAYRAEVLENMGAADAPEWARALESAPYPRQMPAMAGLVASAAGDVWVREYQPVGAPDRPSRWAVFDGAWRPLAVAQGPAGFQLFQIGPDWVLGRQVDENGVEHVRGYPLKKP
jgi:hypothetical protein